MRVKHGARADADALHAAGRARPTTPRWHRLPAAGFGKWLTSDAGDRPLRLHQARDRAARRPPPTGRSCASAGSTPTATASRRRSRPRRPATRPTYRPNLRPLGVQAKPGADGRHARYLVPVVNRGRTAAGAFDVVVSVDGTTLTPASGARARAGRARAGRGPGPAVPAGQMLTVDVDPTGAVDERDEGDNQLSVPCPGAPPEEAHQLLGVAVRRVLDHEVPGAVEHHDLARRGSRRRSDARRPPARRSRPRPTASASARRARELALVGLELLEVARAVELELAAAAVLVAERLEVLVDGVGRRCRSRRRRASAAKPSRSTPSTTARPGPRCAGSRRGRATCRRRRSRCRRSTSAPTASGWSHAQRRPISPPQSWTTSATRSRPCCVAEALERLDVALPGARRVRPASRRSRAGRARARGSPRPPARAGRRATCRTTRDSRGPAGRRGRRARRPRDGEGPASKCRCYWGLHPGSTLRPMKTDIHPEYVEATSAAPAGTSSRRARPRPTSTWRSARTATRSTRASRSWSTRAAASSASSAAPPSRARGDKS